MDGLASGQFDPALVPEAPIGFTKRDSTNTTPLSPKSGGWVAGGGGGREEEEKFIQNRTYARRDS